MKKTTVIIGLLYLLMGAIGASFDAYADEMQGDTAPASDAAIELTPVNKRIGLQPGEERKDAVHIKNISGEPLSFSVYVTPFSNGDGGETQDFDTDTKYTQISRWIQVKNADGQYAERAEYTINAGSDIDVKYKINVPDNAVGGGQYASIIVELTPVYDSEEDIVIISRAAMVIFAEISGDNINRSSSIAGIKSSLFAIGKDIGVHYTVENKGNIDFQSNAEIVVSSVFGEELYRNTTVSNVLPENSKTVTSEWGDTPTFGIYKLDYTISALDITTKGSQLVLALSPLFLGLLVVIFLAAIISAIYVIKKRTIDKDKEIQISHQ